MKIKLNIFFILIILIGFLFRFIKIPYFPPAVNWDEVSHGFNAYSILKTGTDESGFRFPIVNFRAYGDYPLPLNLYLTIPAISIFGLNEFSIRLPHMVLGVITVIATYYLILGLTQKKEAGLLTAFLVAVGPWYFFTSRIVLQSNISIFLLITAMSLFVNRNKNRYLLPISILLLTLSLFAYHTTRIFSPIFLLCLIFLYRKEFWGLFKIRKIHACLSIFLIATFYIILFPIFLNSTSRARSQWVFLIDQGVVNRIIEKRQNSKLSPIITRFIYNRPTFFAKEFISNYLGYFSPDFLFLKGGTQYQFSLPEKGLLYMVNLPLFYIGLIILFIKGFIKKEKVYQLVLFWLLLAPIPASITNEKFAVLRSTSLLPLPEFLTVLGLFFLLNLIKKRNALKIGILIIYSLGLLFGITTYLTKLINEYPKKYSWAWQYGYQDVVNYAKTNYLNYDKVIVTKKYGEPHEFFLFFWPWNPAEYQKDLNLVRFYQLNWYWVDSFDKFYFVNDWQIINKENPQEFILESGSSVSCLKSRCLLITSPDNVSKGWKKVKTVNYLDGKPAFELYEN
jgi:4-amino-4-deoxy-L-arabinose transferase-like glycosyltransferase